METVGLISMVALCAFHFVPVTECLLCYDCSPSPDDSCSETTPGVTRNVSCSGLCYVEVSGFSSTRGCIDGPAENCPGTQLCCESDLCNDGRLSTTATSRPPLQCYQCTYRRSQGTVIGHPSCAPGEFDALHPLVKLVECPSGSSGCSIFEVRAQDDSGSEYIISRDCAAEGYCANVCEVLPTSESCTECCHESLCNGERTPAGDSADGSKENQCYSCSYIKGPSGMIGSPGCYKPFNASGVGIQKVPCDGECSLSVIRNADSVVVQRACQPGCNQTTCEKVGDESENCRYCCSGSLCNSATHFREGALVKCVYMYGPLLVVLSMLRRM